MTQLTPSLNSQLNSMAVLIDADNASAKTIDAVLEAIEKLGKITTKKIYGDWSASGLSASWQEAILRHAIDPMQQFAYVKGKNATDIALVIEAMDLLHSGEYDGFCLVSSDSDFASLAVRIRKSGVKVMGFGRKEAVASFRQACDEFFEVESLKAVQKQLPKRIPTNELKQDTKLINALREVVANFANLDDENWSDYKEVLIAFGKKYSELNHEKYGYEKLIHLIKATELFDVKNDKDNPAILYVKSNTPFKYSTKQLQSDKLLVNTIKSLLDNNPKSENGWVNISYIASELNKNPHINVDKYGYKKFSDLITAIRLFDIKKQPNGMYIKLKQPKNNPTLQNNTKTDLSSNKDTQKPLTLSDLNQKPLILHGEVNVYVYRQSGMDLVLWRLGENKKVRHEGDFVFYGQTQSHDNTIVLDNHDLYDLLICRLSVQDKDIHQLVFSVSHESDVMAKSPIKVVIEQNGKPLFAHQFMANDNISKSAILFSLNRIPDGWRFVPRSQFVGHDLRALCHAFGVEVED